MTWDESTPLAVQVAEQFVEEAAGYESDLDFLRGMYLDVLADRRRENHRERMATRRAIARGERGHIVEAVTCPRCGKTFGRVKGARGRRKVYCSVGCENASAQARHRSKGKGVTPISRG